MMIRHSRTRRSLLSLACVSLLLTIGAEAREVGVYAYVEIHADGGNVGVGPGGQPDSDPQVFVGEGRGGTQKLRLADGQPWFCLTPGCGVAIGSLAGLGWAEADADPFTRTLGARSGAFQNGGPAPDNWVDFLNAWVPVSTWGTASAFSYVSELNRVDGGGVLSPGDPVSVQAALALDGEFTDDLFTDRGLVRPAGRVHAAVFVSRISDIGSDPYWNSGPNLFYGTVTDILSDPGTHGGELLGARDFLTDSLTMETVSWADDLVVNAEVGDLLLFETVLYAETVLWNDDDGRAAWSEYGQTLTGDFAVLTPGGSLTLVPLPAMFWPLLALLAPLLSTRRRR